VRERFERSVYVHVCVCEREREREGGRVARERELERAEESYLQMICITDIHLCTCLGKGRERATIKCDGFY